MQHIILPSIFRCCCQLHPLAVVCRCPATSLSVYNGGIATEITRYARLLFVPPITHPFRVLSDLQNLAVPGMRPSF